MLEQEAAGQNSINSEPSNGAMDITTTTTLPEFVTMTTLTTNTTMPEPMDQDVTVPISTPQACSVQAVQQPAAPATVTPQMFVTRAVSSAPVQSLGNQKIFRTLFCLHLQIASHENTCPIKCC